MNRRNIYILFGVVGLFASIFFVLQSNNQAQKPNLKTLATADLVNMIGENDAAITQEIARRSESGDSVAQFAIAPLYYTGIYGFHLDRKKARDLWKKSCDQGLKASCENFENTAD